MDPELDDRELATLKRAFNLAVEQERLGTGPVIRLLAEHNVRQGFVEPGVFDTIAKGLSEVLSLMWSDVDRDGQRVTLGRELSKNREPRVLPLTGALLELIERRWRAREYRSAV